MQILRPHELQHTYIRLWVKDPEIFFNKFDQFINFLQAQGSKIFFKYWFIASHMNWGVSTHLVIFSFDTF